MKRLLASILLGTMLLGAMAGGALAAPNECPGSNDPVKEKSGPGSPWTCGQGGGVGDGVKPKKDAPPGWR